MKRTLKTILISIVTLTLAVSCLLIPAQTVEAASKPGMKKANVMWDLKKNRTLTYRSHYDGIGMTNQKVRMTNYKVVNSSVKGYKVCTFTLNYTRKWNVRKKQVDKISTKTKTPNNVGGACYYAVTDYTTGKSLSGPNTKGVTVTDGGWIPSCSTYYYGSHGNWLRLSNLTIHVKITYPAKYKGLCIGVGGYTNRNYGDKFFKGKVAFAKTSLYSKKDRRVAHFMRVK